MPRSVSRGCRPCASDPIDTSRRARSAARRRARRLRPRAARGHGRARRARARWSGPSRARRARDVVDRAALSVGSPPAIFVIQFRAVAHQLFGGCQGPCRVRGRGGEAVAVAEAACVARQVQSISASSGAGSAHPACPLRSAREAPRRAGEPPRAHPVRLVLPGHAPRPRTRSRSASPSVTPWTITAARFEREGRTARRGTTKHSPPAPRTPA